VHNKKLIKVLDQLVETTEMEEQKDTPFNQLHSLLSSTYDHSGPCFPDSRTCYKCYRYWCGTCSGGICGMMGSCNYKKCRIGRKNLNRM
jgi:hypothetical protein